MAPTRALSGIRTEPDAPSHHRGWAAESVTPVPTVVSAPMLKRPLDICLAVIGLVLSAPLWLLIVVAIKLEDRGPVLYRQMRWGRGARCFDVLKFRTMVSDSDERFGIVQAEQDDPRVTHVGRVLRASGLDELPQLVNILKGDMSLVGPRPLALGEYITEGDDHRVAYEDAPHFLERLSVHPGLTSPATVFLPKDATPEHKFDLDLNYIATQSIWLDIKLIALSLWVSLRGRWEVRSAKL